MAAAGGWLLMVYVLVNTVWLDGERIGFDIVLVASPLLSWWTTRHLINAWRLRELVPRWLLDRRWHGSLDTVVDSERRPLRSIGISLGEVAARTGAMVGELLTIPNVQIFRGVHPPDASLPPTTHAVTAGRSLVLVESVALPPGRYGTDGHGRVLCDGVYIGQSVRPLLATVRRWQRALPRRHHVSAVVVLHPTVPGEFAFVDPPQRELVWALADDAVEEIRSRLAHKQSTSARAFAALIAGTTDHGSAAWPAPKTARLRLSGGS